MPRLGRSQPVRVSASAGGVLPPPANYENIVGLGAKKAALPIDKALVMGVMAGVYIGFGAFLMASVGGMCQGIGAANPGLKMIISGAFGLPFGLLMVLNMGAELFTGNAALCTAAVIEGKATVGNLLRNWTWSYVGNLIGSLVMVAMVYYSGVMGPASAPVGMAVAKTSQTFLQAFLRGVLCNILVCSGVVQASAAQDMGGKAVGVWFPISAFVALGLEHSVANMFLIPLGMMLGAPVTTSQFVMNNLIPVTLGNIVGAVVFVAIANSYIFGKLGKQ